MGCQQWIAGYVMLDLALHAATASPSHDGAHLALLVAGAQCQVHATCYACCPHILCFYQAAQCLHYAVFFVTMQ